VKVFLIVSILMLSGCKNISYELQNAVAFGVIEELNELDPEIEKQLLLRLYRSPLYVEDCFKETHGICQYNYFLSVSTFDEYPGTNIFKLKTKGEITKVTWRNESKVDSAKLDIIFTKYTSYAINNNDSLDAKSESVQIVVNNENISELFEVQ
jgi:hypothetical protein